MRVGKVLVLGPPEAGKSTLVNLLGDGAINLEYRGRTVGLDHGLLREEDVVLSLVGVPGQERFSVVREALATGAAGAVWVHPSGSEPDPETSTLLAALGGGVPFVVFVNIRQGVSTSAEFSPPIGLRSPLEVMAGDLVRDSVARRRLRGALVRMITTQRP